MHVQQVQLTKYKPSLPPQWASRISSLQPAPPATLKLAECSSSGTRKTKIVRAPQSAQIAGVNVHAASGTDKHISPQPPQISAGCTCCHHQQSRPPPAGHLLPAEPPCPPGAIVDPRSSARHLVASTSWGHPEVRGGINAGRTKIQTHCREIIVNSNKKGALVRAKVLGNLLQLPVFGCGYVQVGVSQANFL